MIYAVITEPGEELPSLYIFDTWDSYHTATFSPENEIHAVADTTIRGRTYQARKNSAYDVLVEMQQLLFVPGLSMGELADISDAAEKIARRYGHLEEARENAVC